MMNSLSAAIQTLCIYALPLIFAITLHEAAHGWTAMRLGDPTAWRMGRVTLNPIPHIDPVGTILVPVGLLFLSALTGTGTALIGWAKPVPVSTRYFRNIRQGMLLTAAAGPLSNILQAVIWVLILKVFVVTGLHEAFFIRMALAGITVNLVLAAFNLIPVPPLDGGRIVSCLLPPGLAWKYERIERYGLVILVVLMMAGVLQYVLRPFLVFGQWLVDVLV